MAAVLALLAIAACVSAYGLVSATRPPALGLASPLARTPAQSTSPGDPLATACGQPPAAAPDTLQGPGGLWVVQPGSLAGYRAREKFAELPSPNVAVARTDRLSGWLKVTANAGAVDLESGCVAVDLATLRSIDRLPGFNTADRDDNVRSFLHTIEHPFAVFHVDREPVAVRSTAGTPVQVRVPGTLELNGMMRPAAFNLVVRRDGDQVAAAGSTIVGVGDYGIEVPQGAEGFVSVDPRITLEVSLILLRH